MRPSPELAILVGVLLVFSPLYVGVFHIGDPTYRLTAAEVEPTDDGFEVHGPYPTWGLDDDIICVGLTDRPCVLERHLLDGANVSTRYGVEFGHYQYEYVYANETFYRVAYDERGGRTALRLEPVPTEDALYHSASPVGAVRAPVRQAVESGSATARQSLLGDSGKLVAESGTYYVVTEEVVRSSTAAERRGEEIEEAVSVLGPVAGLLLVLWGQRGLIRRA
ncbi:hypothetical protein [Halorussus lipolyticus]|uniref:hypothetical protein n=1 Tax=Halorussus lipolyticus TaxID=3034024 RepID=UPI0023E7B7FE|nr:hypothetical protein [Halorussus sp. DT80]